MQAKDLHFLYCFQPFRMEKKKYTMFGESPTSRSHRDVTEVQLYTNADTITVHFH